MRDVLRVTGIGLGVALACLLVAIASYDVFVVRPAMQQLRAMLATASPGDRQPPVRIRILLDAARSPQLSLAGAVGSSLSRRLSPAHSSPSLRMARGLLWPVLLRVHMSRDELYALECTLAYNGMDQGLEPLARRRFGKPLAALDWEEAAEIVAILQGPSSMLRNPGRLAGRKAHLLQAVRGKDATP